MTKSAFMNRGYTFQCPAWNNCKLTQVLLTKVSVLHVLEQHKPHTLCKRPQVSLVLLYLDTIHCLTTTILQYQNKQAPLLS